MNSELTITQYTEKSFVVRGNTKDNKEQLKEMNGKYNSMLKGGPGWIFPNGLRSNIEKYISTGVVTRSVNRSEYVKDIKDSKTNEEKTEKDSNANSNANKIISQISPSNPTSTSDSYIRSLESRIEELEKKMAFVLKSVLTNIQSSPSNKTENEEDDEEETAPRKRLLVRK